MKYADCNARQKKAFRNILHASNWLLGGLENTMLDNPEDSEEYQSAKAQLADHDGLVNELYSMATTEVYDEGSCCFNQAAASYLKDIRFCGKAWLMERCEARIKKAGYTKEVASMWKEGGIRVYHSIFHYWIKVYETGSKWGIDGGKISKLTLKRDGKIVANYDRGWDIEPSDPDTEMAVEILLHSENY